MKELREHTLKQSHAEREKDAHDPELPSTLEEPIERIDQQNEHEVDVEGEHRGTYDRELPDTHSVRVAKQVEGIEACKDNNGVEGGK